MANKYALLYSVDTCRGMDIASLNKIINFIRTHKPERWAVYKQVHNGREFHNATDQDFLVDHNDSYWFNCMVKPSGLVIPLEERDETV